MKNLEKALAGAALAAVLLGAGRAEAANEISFCKFTDLNQQTLALNGAQALTDLVNLTPNLPNQSGTAWVKTPMTLTSTTSFAAHFRFRLYPNSDATGGAGIAFVLQNKGLNAGSGSGGGLGLNGVTPSVAIEFDTAQDTTGDPNANHVAVIQDGKASNHLAVGTPSFVMKNGISTDAWVDYTAPTKTLAVYLSQGTGLKPALPLFTYAMDVYAATKAAQNGNKVIVGFSGATGNTETNTQDVTYLVVGTGTLPSLVDCIPCLVDAQCPANTPACQPNGYCGQCSATNTGACGGGTPVCNTSTGQCAQCTSNAQCSGNEPVCLDNVCVPCAGDNGSGAPAQCPTSTLPVCQTQGPTAGSCTQCSPANTNLCVSPRPVCLANVGTCGCSADVDCGGATSGQICSGTPGVCVPGCRPNGGNTCPNGQQCVVPNGGTTGTCRQPCANGCQGPTPVCNTNADQCVQCLTGTDCQGGQLCNPTTNVCVDCVPGGDTTKCTAAGPGSACRPNGTCGCNTDADCGSTTSGRVCDDSTKVCRAGCRGTGGNGCQAGNVCTSKTTAIGQCEVDVGPGNDDAGADGGSADAGSDGGSSDAGKDGGTTAGDGGPGKGDGGGPGGSGDAGTDDFSIEGGGCACSTLGASSPALSLATFGVTALAFAALARRRRRR